jgi:hypothetical protein
MFFVGYWRYRSAAAKSKCLRKMDTIVPLLWRWPCIMVGRHDALPPCFASRAEPGVRVEWVLVPSDQFEPSHDLPCVCVQNELRVTIHRPTVPM